MTANNLSPSLDMLCQEYVLVQAWKKTASHIRYHNWYADTLELDKASVNLPHFLAELSEQCSNFEGWVSDSLRIVPAPKSQVWRVKADSSKWGPVSSSKTPANLRPLAHVSLRDQVAATALMLCLADRLESAQGDPRVSVKDIHQRKRVISYGNRLLCDGDNHNLKHRWGSTKLYRTYFQDYRTFLSRPEIAAENAIILGRDGLMDIDQPIDLIAAGRIVVVHSDLRQFYDRVKPELLATKLKALMLPNDDPRFFSLATHLLNWHWDVRDQKEVNGYAKQAGLDDFSNVALPQGLVAGGFFANLALYDLDKSLRESFNTDIAPGIQVKDVGRYVDDLRIVLSVPELPDLREIESCVVEWLQGLINKDAPGLLVSEEKTKAATFRTDVRPLIRQSRKMERIQHAISGGFDAIGGEEILDAVQGLIRSQERYSEEQKTLHGWKFSPIPDVRDETVARFAAVRFRSTYRSLRPLLEAMQKDELKGESEVVDDLETHSRVTRNQDDLDNEARAFALGLIENWVEDPSNVRLLRIGLDLWPAADVLASVLELLRPFTEKGGAAKGASKSGVVLLGRDIACWSY